jgi:hypothetical protein
MDTIVAQQTIGGVEFDADNPDSNHTMLQKLMLDERREVIDPNLYNLQGVGNCWFVANQRKRRVCYLIRFMDEELPRIGRVAIPFSLWREFLLPEQGFHTRVTLGPLFDRHGKVMSDKIPSQSGVKLWEGPVHKALQYHLHVYAVNLTHEKVFRVKSIDELADSEMFELIWTKSPKAENWRLLISKEEIPNSMALPANSSH